MWHEKIMRVRTESGRNLWCSLECWCLLLIGWQVLSWCACNITRRLLHNSTTVALRTKQMKPSAFSCLVNILQGKLIIRTWPIPRKCRKVKIFGHFPDKWRVHWRQNWGACYIIFVAMPPATSGPSYLSSTCTCFVNLCVLWGIYILQDVVR